MKKNVSKNDSYIRYGMAVVLIVLAYLYTWWLLIPAVILIITGYRQVCHIYSMFGCSTCKIDTKE